MSMKKMVMVSLTSVLVLTQLADVTTAVAIEAEKKPEKTEVVVPKSPAKEQVVQEKKELVPPVTEQIQKPVTVPTQETQVQSEAKAVIKEEKKAEKSMETVETSKAQTIKKPDEKKEDKKPQAQKASAPVKFGTVYVKYMVYDPERKSYYQDGDSMGFAGEVGETIDLPAPSNPNLEYERGPKTIVVTEKEQEVEVFYRMKEFIPMGGQIHVRYLDEKNNTIENDFWINGRIGEPYGINEIAIEGYDYIGSEGAPLVGVIDKNKKDIILRYKKDKSMARPVEVSYRDIQTGDPIRKTLSLTGNIGESYQVNIPTIDGYTYVIHQGELSGKFTDNHQYVSIKYKKSTNPVKEAKPVTVKYQDENGKEIRPSETLTGKLGESFKAEKVSIKGYSFKESDKPLTGVFLNVEQVINLTYKKDTVKPVEDAKPVMVNYVDELGKTIAKSEVYSGKIGDKFVAPVKTIKGYTFKESDKPLSGELTSVVQTINVVYSKDKEPVKEAKPITVNYVDTKGKTIAKSETLTGKVGEKFNASIKTIKGYTFKESDKPLSGELTSVAQTINVVYSKDKEPVKEAKPATINYVDTKGKTIAKSETLTGKVGDKFNASIKTIKGYTFKESDKPLSGELTTVSQTINVIYNKDKAPEVKAEPVTINYVDEAGKVISEPKVLTGEINKQFKIPTPLIKGYVYKSSDKPLVGSFTTAAQSITLTYAKESKPVETSKPVTVNYVDEAGKVISEAKVLTGKLNDEYKVEVPKIKGYLYKSSDKSLTGKFTTNSQSITLTYNKDKTIVNKKTYVNKNNVVTKNKRKELPKTNEASNLYELIGFSLLGVLAMIKRRVK